MAIITSYKASKLYGMSVEALTKQRKLIPRPAYFVDIKDYDYPKIDDQSKAWTYYLNRYNARMSKTKDNNINKDLNRLINAIGKVLTEEYSEEEAHRIQKMIIQELSD